MLSFAVGSLEQAPASNRNPAAINKWMTLFFIVVSPFFSSPPFKHYIIQINTATDFMIIKKDSLTKLSFLSDNDPFLRVMVIRFDFFSAE